VAVTRRSTSTPYNATGEDAPTQMQVPGYFLAISAPDSEAPAHLEVGGYAPGEMFDTEMSRDKLDVVRRFYSPVTAGIDFSVCVLFVNTVRSLDDAFGAADAPSADEGSGGLLEQTE
jgi:hypothetical protein